MTPGEQVRRDAMTDREQVRRDAELGAVDTIREGLLANHCLALLAELEQAEQREAALVEALTRVLEWPLPQGSVESYSLPSCLAGEARAALAAWEQES